MTLVRRAMERRGLNDPLIPLSSSSLIDWLSGRETTGGVRVTTQTAFGVSAFYRSMGLIASVSAGQDLYAYEGGERFKVVPMPRVLVNPWPEMTPFEWHEGIYQSLMTAGNFYGFKRSADLTVGPDNRGVLEYCEPITASRVKVGRAKEARTETNPSGKIFQIDNDKDVYLPSEVFHVPGLGYDGLTGVSPVKLMAQGLATSMAAELFTAKQFDNGTLISGVLQTDQRLSQKQADELAARWRMKAAGLARAHDIVALGSGTKFQAVQFSPLDVQMMETRKFQVVEVARFFGIPPHLLGDIEKTTSWGSGIEQQNIGYITYTLQPWLNRVCGRFTKELAPANIRVRHDLSDLMRGDSIQRAQYYTSMRNMGALSANEVRAREGLPPIKDGDTYITPLNMGPTTPSPSDTVVPVEEPA